MIFLLQFAFKVPITLEAFVVVAVVGFQMAVELSLSGEDYLTDVAVSIKV
jgi:hypothetical protein